MNRLVTLIFMTAVFAFYANFASAKADAVDLYMTAVTAANIEELEKILAPNFWYIGANGHIRDKENFIREIKDHTLKVNKMAFKNLRETKVGDTRLLTANGLFRGSSFRPHPQGQMRYTMVVADNHGEEQIVLLQATPVIASKDCEDGNCKIK